MTYLKCQKDLELKERKLVQIGILLESRNNLINMGEVTQEISTAIKTFKYTEEQIKLLDFDSGKGLYYELLDWFVKSGDRRWWWEDLKWNPLILLTMKNHFKS